MANKLIFVSGISWAEYEASGFRTRRGELLKAMIKSPDFDEITLVVGTGYRGVSRISAINHPDFSCKLTEVSIPSWLPASLVRPWGYSWLVRNYHVLPEINRFFQHSQPNLIWSYSASMGELIRRKTQVPLLYDLIDFEHTHIDRSRIYDYFWRREIQAACRYSDILICNGETAYQALERHAKKCVLVRNAVEPQRFAAFRGQGKRPGVAGFVGVISKWIDFDLLEYLVSQLPQVQFEFHGVILTAGDKLERMKQYPNFHWLDSISPADVPGFLSCCQIMVIPYNKIFTQVSIGDSMKTYEALAAGTPVVATDLQPNFKEKFAGLIEVCATREEFVAQVQRLLAQAPDPEWQAKAWKFVEANSWQSRITEILNLLDPKAELTLKRGVQ
jgi:glycosyltransferase involved in cell wall biosynthesis